MLYLETVEPGTFSLLENLLSLNELNSFGLVGGTALSLLYGHRISEDLDIFSTLEFQNIEIEQALKKKFKSKLEIRTVNPRFGIFCYISGVKVDIVRHPHPIINPLNTIDGIRMFSVEDIMAMKIQAVLGRGKKKDFYDIAELLNHYTVADFIHCHKTKFSTQNLLISVPQAMLYFADADESEDPKGLKNQTWNGVKKQIADKVRKYLK